MANKNKIDRTCIYCGCSQSQACAGGCGWLIKHKFTPTGICDSTGCVAAFVKHAGKLLTKIASDYVPF